MNKADFLKQLATEGNCTQAEAGRMLGAVLETISSVLAKGDEVAFVGFGTFSVASRPARQGRNPRTGKAIQIGATKVPKFRAGKGLKDQVNKK